MSGRLTTHVLDISTGKPASGVIIELFEYNKPTREYEKLTQTTTNEDGRLDEPLLEGESMKKGIFQLMFHVEEYFNQAGSKQETPSFLDVVPIRFRIASEYDHYHVPLLIAPGGYSTYRGS